MTSPAQQLRLDFLPRNSSLRGRGVRCKAAIEFRLLSSRQLKLLLVFTNNVPDLFDQIQSLSNWQDANFLKKLSV